MVDDAGYCYIAGHYRLLGLFDTIFLLANGAQDVFLAKLDLNGDVMWAKSAGGTQPDYGESLAIDPDGNLVVTAVGSDGSQSTVLWQATAAGQLEVTSGVGVPGEAATLPQTFAMNNDETAIVVEVYFEYTPWLGEMIHSSVISKQSVFRPRFGGLETLENT